MYKPDDKLPFGKCRGETLRDIYKFNPKYIEWLIKYVDNFFIDIGEFFELDKPTPFIPMDGMWMKIESNFVQQGKIFLESGGKIPEVEFEFSHETFAILIQKEEGDYTTPEYKLIRDVIEDEFVVNKSDLIELIPFNKDGKWGFVDVHKNIIIDCKYDDVKQFSNGRAFVRLEKKEGYINKAGQEVVKLTYAQVKPFNEGLACVGLANYSGYIKWGFVDTKGNEIIPCIYNEAHSFSDGLALVESGQCLRRHYSFINKYGIPVLKLGESYTYPFSEGLAGVMADPRTYPAERFGFINKNGKIIIPLLSYDEVNPFSNGLALVKDRNRFYGYINKDGCEIFEVPGSLARPFKEGLASIGYKKKWGFVNQEGEEVVKMKFEEVEPFQESFAKVKLNNKWGFVDKTGSLVIPAKYDFVQSFDEGLAGIKVDNKFGFINSNGLEIIPCKYDQVWYFHEGLAKVKNNGKEGFIDKTGVEYW